MISGKTKRRKKDIAVIVAHPGDETLWCGGTMLLNPNYNWFVVCLYGKTDTERSLKFRKALIALNAKGTMGNLNHGSEQRPLDEKTVKDTILKLLPKQNFDLILTHSPLFGEYTRHLRLEEIGGAVIELWSKQEIVTKQLWTFAFEDGNKEYYPQAIKGSSIHQTLSPNIWKEKYRIITDVYGFGKTGLEAKTMPKTEAFWKFTNPKIAQKRLEEDGVQRQVL